MVLPMRVVRGFEPVEAMHRDFDGLVNRLFEPPLAGANQSAGYAVDVHEDNDHLYIDAELPGFKKEDIDITLENETLTITAERSSTSDIKGNLLLNERRQLRFMRRFTLPTTVSDLKCEAKLNDGVLHITLDKREESKPRKIAVS